MMDLFVSYREICFRRITCKYAMKMSFEYFIHGGRYMYFRAMSKVNKKYSQLVEAKIDN